MILLTFLINSSWALEAEQKVAVESNFWKGIANAGIVVQSLLLGMIVLSVWNWFIIFKKQAQFKKIEFENDNFLADFWKASNLQQIHSDLDKHMQSPIARVFGSGYKEIERLLGANQSNWLLSGMENLERALRKSHDQEVEWMEQNLSVLATTGSTAPFIGLLGTVIGIMNSFGDIAKTGSASLAVVAPGISEALFATAVGLFAAIPAVVFYNYLINKIKRLENQLNGFNSDFLNIARRNFFKSPNPTP